MKHRPFR